MNNIIADHRPGCRSLDADAERLLSSFGDHLLRERLSDNRHAPFFVRWVREYLRQPPRHHLLLTVRPLHWLQCLCPSPSISAVADGTTACPVVHVPGTIIWGAWHFCGGVLR